eukprot:CAMPEP_0196229076 /NCGR_PEP_ID=MMETSP0913-20130531/783_1 /TAXON_ID=49265 /ORGANISM="Thalassiosira rotula, Strain GSO102" /LENGTH=149 /DNA_ID=CAMNT_0041508841 /DNA_START=173 /DNA_END=622 /DNA_ORIENTATION=-
MNSLEQAFIEGMMTTSSVSEFDASNFDSLMKTNNSLERMAIEDDNNDGVSPLSASLMSMSTSCSVSEFDASRFDSCMSLTFPSSSTPSTPSSPCSTSSFGSVSSAMSRCPGVNNLSSLGHASSNMGSNMPSMISGAPKGWGHFIDTPSR